MVRRSGQDQLGGTTDPNIYGVLASRFLELTTKKTLTEFYGKNSVTHESLCGLFLVFMDNNVTRGA